jgi:hypothetical protein
MIAERVHPLAVPKSLVVPEERELPRFGVRSHPTNFRVTLATISVHYVPP